MLTSPNIYLYLDVSVPEALRRGQTTAGKIALQLDHALLAELGDVCARLAPHAGTDQKKPPYGTVWLPVDGLDADSIRAGLERHEAATASETARKMALEAERQAAVKAERDAEIEAARQSSIDDLIAKCCPYGVEPQTQLTGRRTEILKAAGRLDEVESEIDRRKVENAEKKAAAAAEKAAAEKAAAEEAAAWIEAHGSQRLCRLLDEGIELRAVYRDERLAMERPGWQWRDDVGKLHEPRNASTEALAMLDVARDILPQDERASAKLHWWTVEACDHDCDGDNDCPGYHEGIRTYVVIAEFLGREIQFLSDPPM